MGRLRRNLVADLSGGPASTFASFGWSNVVRIDIKMPDLSATEGSDILVKRWLVTVGSRVKRGQPLLEVETDKANTEVESMATGTIVEILAPPDEKVAIGQVIARIEGDA